MTTHNICFYGEIREILCGYQLLYWAMVVTKMLLHEKIHIEEIEKIHTFCPTIQCKDFFLRITFSVHLYSRFSPLFCDQQ